MRPVDVVRTINATPLGAVLNERQLYRHRARAGDQIGEGKKVDFCAYAAWLCRRRHHLKRLSESLTGKPTARKVLKLIERQERRCALTGREPSPATAALDHMLPVCRGGTHTLENAQVLHKAVNRAKGTMINEEFITICCEVVAHRASAIS